MQSEWKCFYINSRHANEGEGNETRPIPQHTRQSQYSRSNCADKCFNFPANFSCLPMIAALQGVGFKTMCLKSNFLIALQTSPETRRSCKNKRRRCWWGSCEAPSFNIHGAEEQHFRINIRKQFSHSNSFLPGTAVVPPVCVQCAYEATKNVPLCIRSVRRMSREPGFEQRRR
jgi:hypothetical protein